MGLKSADIPPSPLNGRGERGGFLAGMRLVQTAAFDPADLFRLFPAGR
jgi:hypothetical protein